MGHAPKPQATYTLLVTLLVLEKNAWRKRPAVNPHPRTEPATADVATMSSLASGVAH